MKKPLFIRFKNTKIGGAELYLCRITQAIYDKNPPIFSSGNYSQDSKLFIKIPKFLPSFLAFLYFLYHYEKFRKSNPQFLYFSLERVLHCDIYRAGDGIHRQWLAIKTHNNPFKKFKTFFNPMNLLYTFLEPKLFKNTKKIIANSQMIKDSLIEYFGIPPSKIEVIYNGIKIPKIINKPKAKESLIKKFPDLKDKTLILFVGSGYARKGLKEAILILSKLNSKQWYFLIIGKDKKVAYYQKLVKKLSLEEHILFLNAQENIESFYQASDIFLFPTAYEPCSNATLEAASYENAILTTKQNGAGELFSSNLLLESPQEISKGCEILNTLLENQQLLSTLQKECAKAVQHLTLQNHLDKTLEIIKNL
ncbi:glycosyltransferase family 4 protein [Helicobacter mesocricetorum]|uniref:glycosyltransferase family 4 protein n=1 Tax=Helicobacter mesocricetorum TaxID=87012 RepID=UPI000CF05CBD|nr:glycosyltransferase family 4 protein [Helicobacter mesocricetorum]